MAPAQDRYLRIIIVALTALLAAAIVLLILDRRDGPQPLEIAFDGPTPGPGGPIEVYITGAVATPGVYEMAAGERVVDLVLKAGGQTGDADIEAVNLALRLDDEDQVVIPRQGQALPQVAAGASSQVLGISGPVNINTASAQELDALPGIGEVYSQRIVDSRTLDGPFASADELVTRRIIPRGTFDKIVDLITVGP